MRFDAIPIWAVFVATIVVVMVAIEAGYRLGHAVHRRSEDEKESPVSAIAGTILGLAAFMLAFTFGIVSERYAARRALVRDEAVAIRTAWQRSDFLPEADRAEAAALLRDYVDARVAFAQTGSLEPERVKSMLADAQQRQARLWNMAVVNARKDMNSDVAALYIDSLNEVNGMHASRVAVGIQARVPSEIWLALYCITMLGMLSVGYQTGIAGSKRSLAWPILALSFALVFALIAALDRPDSGILKVTQQPLIDLRDAMDALERECGAAGESPGGLNLIAPFRSDGSRHSRFWLDEDPCVGATTVVPATLFGIDNEVRSWPTATLPSCSSSASRRFSRSRCSPNRRWPRPSPSRPPRTRRCRARSRPSSSRRTTASTTSNAT